MSRSRWSLIPLIALPLLAPAMAGVAQTTSSPAFTQTTLPVTRVVLFSAGIGYFEHRGPVAGNVAVSLPFATDDINDALKSLVVRNGDGDQGSPSVDYPTSEDLDRALKSFRVDLSGSPDIAGILSRMRGAEVSVDTPDTLIGRIVGIEQRPGKIEGTEVPWLMLLTRSGLRALSLEGIVAIRFADPLIAADFDRALGLILAARDVDKKILEVSLPGSANREAVIGYVVPSPIWKASYRLDLSGERPYFQGWAVVDNPTEQDWKSVTLSLVSGKPVSFIQDLYSPLYVERPTLPLAIAGAAKPRSFESGMEAEMAMDSGGAAKSLSFSEYAPMPSAAMAPPPAPRVAAPAFGGNAPGSMETASARAAGDQFEFTVKRPVTLDRRRSAMIPLVDGTFEASKVSIYSPGSGSRNTSTHPMLGAKIKNTSGLPLPAGPVTVFDGGVYAGDALLDFLPENETRLIAFGEDLAVTASASLTSSQETSSVKIEKGVMIFSRRITWSRNYAFRNAATKAKTIILEHPITSGAELAEPATPDEKTPSLYRFSLEIGAAKDMGFKVVERSPAYERITLSGLSIDSFLSYASSKEIPEAVRKALEKAISLRRAMDDAKRQQQELQTRKTELTTEQDRLRKNLESAGRDTELGRQYIKKMTDSEKEIESVNASLQAARKSQQQAQQDFEKYLADLSI